MGTSTGAISPARRESADSSRGRRPGPNPSSQGKRQLSSGETQRQRWPYAGPDQLPLLLSSLAIIVGSFLPWVVVGSGLQVSGFRGAGLWTFYAASLGLAGALVRRRRLAATSAAVAGVVAVALTAWQILHLVAQVGFDGWRPGLGLLMVAIGGVIALRSAWRLAPAAGATAGRTTPPGRPGRGSG